MILFEKGSSKLLKTYKFVDVACGIAHIIATKFVKKRYLTRQVAVIFKSAQKYGCYT